MKFIKKHINDFKNRKETPIFTQESLFCNFKLDKPTELSPKYTYHRLLRLLRGVVVQKD